MEELYAGLFLAMNRLENCGSRTVFRYDKKRRHDALGNFTKPNQEKNNGELSSV